jgi:pyridoxamine 5'-phosphate oxidase
METNPHACLMFYWAEFERQIRINGIIEKTSREVSANYFKTRPRESQLGAWASRQSQPLDKRETLEARYEKLEEKYKGIEVPLPDFWGGFLLKPERIEFWQGRPNRLHDRFEYIKNSETWTISRLYP